MTHSVRSLAFFTRPSRLLRFTPYSPAARNLDYDTDKEYGPIVQPIFISVDPARDTVSQVARYVSEFHPRLIGLTGDYATLKATCKAYRVYFSTPPNAKPTDDYLVDHSIFFYFMDPDGKFVDAFGKVSTVEDVVARVQKEIAAWKERTGNTV